MPGRSATRRRRRGCARGSSTSTAATRCRAELGSGSPGFRRSSTRHIRPAERRFHLAAHPHGEVVLVVIDIAPLEAFALGEVALEPDLMRKPERQETLGERALGRHLLAPDAEAAFAVEHLAPLE